MFRRIALPVRPGWAEQPLDLPIDLLLCIAPGAHPPYNLFEVIYRRLLGDVPWSEATAVLRPRVWAPDWSDEELAAFTGAAGLPAAEPGVLRVSGTDWPWIQEVVHWCGPLP
ncbi:MAG TPA: hypothetical protein VF832_19955, partial [Longimicrobiales bacterium]